MNYATLAVPGREMPTTDALTLMHVPAKFDVTKWPREVEAFLHKTTNPHHRAMLKNYFRHLLLEVAGYWDQIIVPQLIGSGNYWLPKEVKSPLTLVDVRKFENGFVHLHYRRDANAI